MDDLGLICLVQKCGQFGVSSIVLTETMSDLEYAAHTPAPWPTIACDLQAILARDSEFLVRISRCVHARLGSIPPW